MSIAEFRDIVLSIFFILASVVLIGAGIALLILFLKVRKILNAVNTIVARARALSEYAAQISKPLITIVAFMQGFSQGMKKAGELFKKKKKEEPK